MTQEGLISFFSTAKLHRPTLVLEQVLAHLAPGRLLRASRARHKDRRWRDFRRRGYGSEVDLEDLGELTIQQCIKEYREELPLLIDLGGIPVQQKLAKAILDGIEAETRGDFVPRSGGVEIGFHDVFECAEHEEGFLFGRAFLEIQFHGYSSPNDWESFRSKLFALPEFNEVRDELQAIVGPLQQCVYWIV
jgi:hypothetical protein